MDSAPTDAISREALHSTVHLLIESLCSIKDETGEFLETLPDGRVIDTKSWDTDTFNWTHGVGLYGIWRYFMLTRDSTVKECVVSWFTRRFLSGVKVDKNVNTMAPCLALAYLYEEEAEPRHSSTLEEWAHWAMHGLNRTKYGGMEHDTYQGANLGQLWDDTLMMTVLPLAKIGILLRKAEYVEEAKYQFLLHIKYLFDPSTGALFHGWTFEDGGHSFARARWARGNSWLTIAIPDFVEMLDAVDEAAAGWSQRDPIRRQLLETLDAQMSFLTDSQDEFTGMWHTLLDHGDSYLESSATAGFAYGILKAIRLGLCPASATGEYIATAEKAIRAILANVDAEGELQNTSFGTAMGSDLDFYRKIPVTSMPYGQAMAIMAVGEYLQRK